MICFHLFIVRPNAHNQTSKPLNSTYKFYQWIWLVSPIASTRQHTIHQKLWPMSSGGDSRSFKFMCCQFALLVTSAAAPICFPLHFFFSPELSARFSLQQNDNAQAIYLCHFNGVGYVFDRLRVCRSCFSFEAKTKRRKNPKWKWDDDKDHAMSAPETSKKLYIRKRSRTERGKMQNVYSLECRSMMWIRKFSRVCLQLVRSFGFPLCGQIGGDGAAAAASNTMTMRMDIGPLSMRRAHAFMQPSNFYDWKKGFVTQRLCSGSHGCRNGWMEISSIDSMRHTHNNIYQNQHAPCIH